MAHSTQAPFQRAIVGLALTDFIGYGSNLTLGGQVECDASLMDGRSQSFGAVGALSGRKAHYLMAFKLKEVYMYLQVSRTLLPLPVSSLSEASSEGHWAVFLPCWDPHLITILPSYWYP